ncbi:hypothetical protein QE152_g5995 [Popillia japonica]|uniref:Uncharacterized protein n=1 Tax=Popillia japonica TaxID=7064 RepID=A0AAW1MKI2_POPJA
MTPPFLPSPSPKKNDIQHHNKEDPTTIEEVAFPSKTLQFHFKQGIPKTGPSFRPDFSLTRFQKRSRPFPFSPLKRAWKEGKGKRGKDPSPLHHFRSDFLFPPLPHVPFRKAQTVCYSTLGHRRRGSQRWITGRRDG